MVIVGMVIDGSTTVVCAGSTDLSSERVTMNATTPAAIRATAATAAYAAFDVPCSGSGCGIQLGVGVGGTWPKAPCGEPKAPCGGPMGGWAGGNDGLGRGWPGCDGSGKAGGLLICCSWVRIGVRASA